MNKKELVTKMAESAGISKKAAGMALQAFMDTVTESLKNDDKVFLNRFGTFRIHYSPIRCYRNPQTGEKMMAPPQKKVKFKASSLLNREIASKM